MRQFGGEHSTYEEIRVYTNEPDQAILARKDRRCYVAFRGSKSTSLGDWKQNFDLRSRKIYKDNIEKGHHNKWCKAQASFADFMSTVEVANGRADTLDCVKKCKDPLDCLVLAGHSQGGASAAIASILLYSAHLTIVTFGQPVAIHADCSLVPSERFYWYVNSIVEEDESDDLGFDLVPFLPNGYAHYGSCLLLGDSGGVKYLGSDQEISFKPSIIDCVFDCDLSAHKMDGRKYSYMARIQGIFYRPKRKFPISTDGFPDGAVCEPGYDFLCGSGSCCDNQCLSKVKHLCINNSRKKNGDCESDKCILHSCAKGNGQVTNGCPCRRNMDCLSRDCDKLACKESSSRSLRARQE